jgi:hypothetical protein
MGSRQLVLCGEVPAVRIRTFPGHLGDLWAVWAGGGSVPCSLSPLHPCLHSDAGADSDSDAGQGMMPAAEE